MTTDSLPPLPEPTMRELNPYLGQPVIDPYKGMRELVWFTADQMRAYVLADRALRPSGGRELSDEQLDALNREELRLQAIERGDIHQVSAPVEISSCATCGHPVESGGERPAEDDLAEYWRKRWVRDCRALDKPTDEAVKFAMNGTEWLPLHSVEEAGEFVRFMLRRFAAVLTQESGSTECKESSPLSPCPGCPSLCDYCGPNDPRTIAEQTKELIMNEVTPIQPPGAANLGRGSSE